MEILKSFDGLLPETVIPTKAGIQVLFLGPRLRGDDDQENLALANAKPVPRRAGATTVESVITFENCHIRLTVMDASRSARGKPGLGSPTD